MQRKISRLKAQRFEIINGLLPKGIRYDREKVQTSASDSMSVIMARVDEVDREIDELKKERALSIVAISKAIEEGIKNEFDKDVITYRFIKRYNPVKTSIALNCHEQTVYNAQRRGLREINAFLKSYSDI